MPSVPPGELGTLYEYWSRKRAGRRMPRREDISPFELPPSVLPHLMLLDLSMTDHGLQIRFRLTGTHIDEALGFNPTGQVLCPEKFSNHRYVQYIQSLYTELVRYGTAIYSENIFQLAGQPVPMITKRLSLPLSNDDLSVEMALVGAVFDYPATNGARYGAMLDDFSETVRHVLPA